MVIICRDEQMLIVLAQNHSHSFHRVSDHSLTCSCYMIALKQKEDVSTD